MSNSIPTRSDLDPWPNAPQPHPGDGFDLSSHRHQLITELFPKLFTGSAAQRRDVYDKIRAVAVPERILELALETYATEGDTSHLTTAAALLLDLGAQSWPVLRELARTQKPECAYFVPAIANFSGISPAQRLELLRSLADANDAETRWQVSEAMAHMNDEK